MSIYWFDMVWHYAVVFLFALAFLIPLTVDATPYPDNTKTIGIQLSQSCRTMIENNVTSNCPTYEQLYDLGWDNSLPGSGEFYYDEHGMFERGLPTYKNIHELYRFWDNKILIDPPNELATRSKLIVINPTLPVYIPTGGYDKIEHKRTLAHDRYVDSCRVATITAENWEFLISDTIYYLRSNCEKTSFDHLEVIEDYVSTMNKETAKWYKHEKWLEESIEKCKTQICKEY